MKEWNITNWENYKLLKEAISLLELALWKAKLEEELQEAFKNIEVDTTKIANMDMKAKGKRVASHQEQV